MAQSVGASRGRPLTATAPAGRTQKHLDTPPSKQLYVQAMNKPSLKHIEDEIRMRILKILETADQDITQREMARRLNISLGKTNYCLAGLVEKGCVRIRRFKNSRNKAAYAYLLTPCGIEEKVQLTLKFLKLKLREYEILEKEIEELRTEVASLQSESGLDISI